MSCTSKKIESGGPPCLPGSKEWLKFEAKKRQEREAIENAEPMIDSKPPRVNIKKEIDLFTIQAQENERTKRELANRYMLNSIAVTLQSKTDVDTVNTAKRNDPNRRITVKGEAEKLMRDNMQLVSKLGKIESDYDAIDLANEYQSARSRREKMLRYNPKDWDPVFERMRRRQELRGRSLDPNYKFRF